MTVRRALPLLLVTLAGLAGCKSCSKAPSSPPPVSSATGSTEVLGTLVTGASSVPALVAGGGVAEPVALPVGVAVDGTPQFSLDGQRLAFSARVNGRHQIFVADRSGRNLRRLSDGKADDIDPTFGDGHTVFFASNAAGSYDIWKMKDDGADRRNLTHSPGDELWPRVSPIEFRLEPQTSGGNEAGSAEVHPLTYHRVLFQRGVGAAASVWGMLDDGRFPVRVSPPGLATSHPAWSPDGLRVIFEAERDGAKVLVLGTGHTVDRDCGKAACPPFLQLAEPGPDPQGPWREINVTLEQALQAPKDWFAYDLRVLEGTRGLVLPAFFANQAALLAVRQEKDRSAELRAVDFAGGASVVLAQDLQPGTGAAFSPLGSEIAFASAEPAGTLRLATSRFYLSEALNLYQYPELIRSKPAKLAANRFVVVPGTEREFFHVLEKVRYAKKGVFVSADAVVQLLHDILEAGAQRAERAHVAPLKELLHALLVAALGQHPSDAAQEDAADLGALAAHVAVPLVLLSEVASPEPSAQPVRGAEHPENLVKVSLDRVLQDLKLPAGIEERVRVAVRRVHAAREVADGIDYTRFAPRGHYDDDGLLAAWFRAVTWLGMAPLGDAAHPGPWLLAWKLMNQHGLWAAWERLDADASFLAGPPEDPSFRDLAALAAKQPKLASTSSQEEARALVLGVTGLRPANRIAGVPIAAATSAGEARELARKKQLFFLPQRASPDDAWLQALTTPFVKDRPYPNPLDLLAVLGSGRAHEILERGELAAPAAQAYAPAYRRALASLAAEGQRAATATATSDLPAAWLRAMALLATPPSASEGIVPAFAASEGWKDRALVSAVAAYAMYKHAAVLYAKQVTAAEAGEGGDDLAFWRELPLEKAVRGYVEPHPRLYAWLAKVAAQAEVLVPPRSDQVRGKASELFGRLQAISEKELARRPLTAEEYAWIDLAGASIEQFYVEGSEGEAEIDRTPERLQYGVKLVSDVLTNLNEHRVLQVATGDVSTLYVVTPHGDEQLLTQGGAHEVYVFTQPMDQRLSDKAWGELVDAGKQPPPPPWTQSFVERLR